jgi:hypothetical protein
MSSEPPPQPVSDTFNYSQWTDTTSTNATTAWVKRNFLSKVLSDVAQGLISFVSGIKTNSILVYSGTTLSIGASGSTISIYNPTSSSIILATDDNTTKIPTTSWIQLWFTNIVTSVSLSWGQVQDFVSINTNLITPRVANTDFNIYSSANERSNVNILCGEYNSMTAAGNLNIMSGIMGAGNTNGNINIQTGTSTGDMIIGNNKSSLDLKAGTITLYKPLSLNYAYTATGTGVDRLGEVFSGSYTASGAFQSGAAKTYSSILLTTKGFYNLQAQGSIVAFNTTNISSFKAWVDSDVENSPYGSRYGQYTSFNLGTFTGTDNVEFCFSSTIYNVGVSPVGTNTYRLYISTGFTGTTPTISEYNFKFLITRIA